MLSFEPGVGAVAGVIQEKVLANSGVEARVAGAFIDFRAADPITFVASLTRARVATDFVVAQSVHLMALPLFLCSKGRRAEHRRSVESTLSDDTTATLVHVLAAVVRA